MDVRDFAKQCSSMRATAVEIPSRYVLFTTFDSAEDLETWSRGRLELDERRELYMCADAEAFQCRYKAYARRKRSGKVELWVRPGPHIHDPTMDGAAKERRVGRSRTSTTELTHQPEVRSPPQLTRYPVTGRQTTAKRRRGGPRRVLGLDGDAPKLNYVLVEKIPSTADVESLLVRLFSFLHSTTSPPSVWELRRDTREQMGLVWLAGYLDRRQAKLAAALLDEQELCGWSVRAKLLLAGDEEHESGVPKARKMPLVEDSCVWRPETTVMTIERAATSRATTAKIFSPHPPRGLIPPWAVAPLSSHLLPPPPPLWAVASSSSHLI